VDFGQIASVAGTQLKVLLDRKILQLTDTSRMKLKAKGRSAFIGLVLGVCGGLAATRLIQSMLYATHALDPIMFAAVTVVLVAVAAEACAVPAWRASRLEPMVALRNE
jgi:hypothetical protein